MEHQDYSVFPNQGGEYAVITGDGEGTHQIPAGLMTGIDEIVRYQATGKPVSNNEVALGITLAELADGEASARVYADVNGGSESIHHKKDYNLEIEIDGETFRG